VARFEAIPKLADRTKVRVDQFREADDIGTNQPAMTPLVIFQRSTNLGHFKSCAQFRWFSAVST
jgi:hypothetical protein